MRPRTRHPPLRRTRTRPCLRQLERETEQVTCVHEVPGDAEPGARRSAHGLVFAHPRRQLRQLEQAKGADVQRRSLASLALGLPVLSSLVRSSGGGHGR